MKRTATPEELRITEEPKTNITQLPGKVLVEIELPGVKNEDDIEIKELDESTEVKALAKDKVFFKIITLPDGLSLAAEEFNNGKLKLSFGY